MDRIRLLLPVALAFSLTAGALFAVGRVAQVEDGAPRAAVTLPESSPALEDIEWSSAVLTTGAVQRQVLDREITLALVLASILMLASLLTAVAYELLRGVSRREELAIHRAVGASLRTLGRAAASEGALVTVVGIVTGWALGSAGGELALSAWPGAVASGTDSSYLLVPTAVLAGAFFAISYGSWQAATGTVTAHHGAVVRPPPPDPYSGIAIVQVAGSVALLVAATVLVSAGGQDPSPGGQGLDIGGNSEGVVATVRGANTLDTLQLLAGLRLVPGVSSAWVTTPGATLGLGTTDIALTECGRCLIGTSPVHIKGQDAVHHAVAWVGDRAPFELVAGRSFGPDDGPEDEPVAVVSELFAQRNFENGDAIGRRVRPGSGLDAWHRVIGISSSGLERAGFGSAAQPGVEVYLSAVQHPGRAVEVYAEGPVEEAAVLGAIRRVAGDVDLSTSSLASHVEASMAPARWLGGLFGALGLVALLSSLLGIRAVTRLSLGVRRTQFGIHRAVGANRLAMGRLALGQPLRTSVFGTALGLYVSTFFLASLADAVGAPMPDLGALLGIGLLHVGAALAGAIPVTVRFTRLSPHSLLSDVG